jgi:aldose 1-epimerase
VITQPPPDAPATLSGHQFSISFGQHQATVTDIGAKVRQYAVGGRDVFTPFGADEVAPTGDGAVLAPWPNRLRDGRYAFAGKEYQLDISEPPTGTALHGLVMWQRWTVVPVADADHEADAAVTLELRLPASGGYPFDLHLRVTYRIGPDGLAVTASTTNRGSTPAPYGIGFHPWLSPGDASLDECTVQLDAATRVLVDDRLLPVGTEPASGTYDLRTPRPMRHLDLDDAYLDPIRDDAGLSWTRLTGADGRTAAVWMDGSMDCWQVCSGDHIQPAVRRTGLATEPMTCIADALRTGDRLVVLEPGECHEVRWGATLF